jgi:predicted DNA-binding protein (UPF0251 family)
MGRTKKDRKIQMAPHFSGFKPQGVQCKTGEDVCINFEEYEAVSLCDYELLTQAEAANMMNVSRPTFTRIYESARRKIAKAFVEGSCIHFEGGNVVIANWYKCSTCKITFTLPENGDQFCPFCKSLVIIENN